MRRSNHHRPLNLAISYVAPGVQLHRLYPSRRWAWPSTEDQARAIIEILARAVPAATVNKVGELIHVPDLWDRIMEVQRCSKQSNG